MGWMVEVLGVGGGVGGGGEGVFTWYYLTLSRSNNGEKYLSDVRRNVVRRRGWDTNYHFEVGREVAFNLKVLHAIIGGRAAIISSCRHIVTSLLLLSLPDHHLP